MWNIDEVIFLEILKNSNLRHTYDNKDAIFYISCLNLVFWYINKKVSLYHCFKISTI